MSEPAPLTGEPLALDLVNTRPNGPDGPVDLIATPERLRSWLEWQHHRVPRFPRPLGDPPGELPAGGPEAIKAAEGPATPTAAALAAVHEVREHAATAIDHARHGEAPPTATLHGLTRVQRAAPAYRELTWDGVAITAAPRRSGPDHAHLAAHLADATADLLTDPAVTTVRRCEGRDCVLLFLPVNPRRRWCSASRCGNRARVARYYHRHRTT